MGGSPDCATTRKWTLRMGNYTVAEEVWARFEEQPASSPNGNPLCAASSMERYLDLSLSEKDGLKSIAELTTTYQPLTA
jgi:hypothetical protein